MIKYKYLEVFDWVFYKHARLDIEEGITVIYGLNKDAGQETDNSNASGKSLLVNALPQIILETTAVNDSKRTKKDSFKNGTLLKLSFEKDDYTYEINKGMENSTFVYDLKRDGKSSKVRTAEYARDTISKLLPWSETELYTFQYLDSRRPNDLQFGSPTVRFEFFSKLFHLDNLDTFRQILRTELNELKEHTLKLNILKDSYAELKATCKTAIEIQELHQEVIDMENSISCASIKLSDAQKKVTRFNQVLLYKDRWDALLDKYDQKSVEEIRLALQEEIKRVKALLRATYDKEIYEKELATYTRNAQRLQPKLNHFKKLDESTQSLVDLLEEKGDLQQQITQIRSTLRKLPDTFTVDELTAEEIEWLTDNDKATLAEDIKEVSSTLISADDSWQLEKKKLQKFQSAFCDDVAECPVCTQTLNASQRTEIEDLFSKNIGKLQRRIEKIKTWLRMAKQISKKVTDLSNTTIHKEQHEKLTTDLDGVVKQLEDTNLGIEIKTTLKNLEAELGRPPTAPTTEITESSSCLENIIQQVQSDLQFLKDMESLETDLNTYSKEQLKTLKNICDSLLDELEEKRSALPELKMQLKTVNGNRVKLDEVTTDIEALEKTLEDKEMLEILYEAYSKNGIKTLIVNKLSSFIEKGLNTYAKLLFREHVTFKFIVGLNTFDILAERHYGKEKVCSDVRNLSGAESRAFNCLLPLAVIPLIPSNRRSNLMILDEPVVNMDASFKEMFLTKFLPQLNTVIPSIIMLTPLNDEIVPNARCLRVTKENGVSTLNAI